MKKPALRKNRLKTLEFNETSWTKKSKNIGEYIFRRLSLDQSNKDFQNIRPIHQMSKLVVTSKEINSYVNDYLKMVDKKRNIKYFEKINENLFSDSFELDIEFPEYLGRS